MSEQVDSLKDLLLSAHFKINNVKDVTKETGIDVARIHLKLDQIVKEAIKIATKVQAGSKAISTSLSSRFKEMSTGKHITKKEKNQSWIPSNQVKITNQES
ncbi:hypothetical protein H5410_036927 [Solanum commersonii]|uniref:Uncharacterized protein n=1 Tax=Solanum commersonii TaxID=4109 RepID=A0A9J5Y720_SOLCO|nr:hypothetical protein H5410_036927 [Solanum commersonii]